MTASRMIDAISKAIYAHGAWKQKLRNAIASGDTDLIMEMARDDSKCDLGILLDSPAIPQGMRATMSYQIVRRLHSEFHVCAGDVLAQAQVDRTGVADMLLSGECSDRSQVLIAALTRWKAELSQAANAAKGLFGNRTSSAATSAADADLG